MSDRETLEMDMAYELEQLELGAVLYATDAQQARTDARDRIEFAVELASFNGRAIAAAHYRLLRVMHHEDAGRVLFVDPNASAPRAMSRARRILLSSRERERARDRAVQRHPLPSVRDESPAECVPTVSPFADRTRVPASAWGRLGCFDRRYLKLRTVTEICAIAPRAFERATDAPCGCLPARGTVSIPLPVNLTFARPLGGPAGEQLEAGRRTRARVLIVTGDLDEARAVARELAGEIDVIAVDDGWTAMDLLAADTFELVVCDIAICDVSGKKLYSTLLRARTDIPRKFALLAAAVSLAPDPRDVDRLLTKPLRAAALRGLLGRRARAR